MKRRRHTPEQVVRKLREAERLLAEGNTIPEVAKALEVSENTFHRWRAQFDSDRGSVLTGHLVLFRIWHNVKVESCHSPNYWDDTSLQANLTPPRRAPS